jgi:hypothetical protein
MQTLEKPRLRSIPAYCSVVVHNDGQREHELGAVA